jgi:uncharacterized protein
MTVPDYSWPLCGEFVNRTTEQARLQDWWVDGTREPLTIIGRRRVGKSWLFRMFAVGKPAIILVAEQLPARSQLTRFADILEPMLGLRPELPDVQTLIRVLYKMAGDRKTLVVIDEFPWLLGNSAAETRRTLTSIQAVMEEERDHSRLKLVLCGSQVALMETLFTEKNPMHGRLQRLAIRPLPFREAVQFLPGLRPLAAFERFAIAGGMPMYLSKLSRGTLRQAVCGMVLDKDSPLFNEGRSIVEQELREPRLYFAILEQLASGSEAVNEIAQRVNAESSAVTKYLAKLENLRLVSRGVPFGAGATSRSGRWRLDDEFLRFWFRFVFPFQSDLESGLGAYALFDNEVAESVADHVAPVFESWCLEWLRSKSFGGATKFGNWWGNATDELRRVKERSSEEIDAVGSHRNTVTVVAEAKWTTTELTPAIVHDLEKYKIPALRQTGIKVAARPAIVLFSRAGYSSSLRDLARREARLELVDVAEALDHSRES